MTLVLVNVLPIVPNFDVNVDSVVAPNEGTTGVIPSSCCNPIVSAYIVGKPVLPSSGAGWKPATPL